MLQEINKELKEHIIPFWKSLRDDENGGFYGLLDYELNLDKKAPKGAILNSRILWFFSRAYAELGDKALLEYADHAYKFMKTSMLDKKCGICWSVTYDGQVLDSTRHTYNQAFAIYALSEYYKACGRTEVLDEALDLFYLIEEKCRDDGGYLEAFDENFRLLPNDKLSENGVLADRTMNTALHILEAYTLLFEVTGDAAIKKQVGNRLSELLVTINNKIYDRDKKRQEVFFDLEYNSLIDLYSYGHDIEASWLIDLAVNTLGEGYLDKGIEKQIREMTLDMARNTMENALIDGSFINECENAVNDTTRIWWVQSEAMVGFANAYTKTRELQFLSAVRSIWEYTKENMIDKREGSEWFWQVDEKGNPATKPIVEPWKCPYHNGRMCFEIIERLKKEL